ncbi:prolyl oligopeptidase family serine peptidase [Catenovulum sp. 2E275]|uniref:alpha/beta hydrolase family protein n=1 Tax=Catenovulum sp. 2E275 TaxID=2980497 RepID=UPI0021D0A680|nr:prolyl oligopeptidase family serine peptidase [Catenovulum sp. 2E275]MCU4675049.1 prolyl oligopeptidase family serine peptidase [Catenovulum sp. 2E275]
MRYFTQFLFLLTLFLSGFASANPQAALPLSAYATLPEVSLVRISPDGSRSAYRYVTQDKDLLVIADLKSGEAISAINIHEINPNNIMFLDNNRVVLQVYQISRRETLGAAFLYDIKQQELRQLLKAEKGVGGTNHSRIVGVHWDDNKILMPALYKKPETDRKYTGGHRNTLMAVDLDGKRSARPFSRSVHNAIDFFVDEQGELLVRELYSNEQDLHQVEVRKNDEWVEIYREITPEIYKDFVGFTPNRDKLVFLTYQNSENRSFYTMSLADGKIEGPLFAKVNADIESALVDIQRVVYGVEYAGFYPTYAFFDKKQEVIYQAIQGAMPQKHALEIVDFNPSWEDIVFKIEGPEAVSQYLLFANNEFSFLGDAAPQIPLDKFNSIEITEFKARDGLTIPTLLTYPNGKAKQNLPAILMPHGGPQSYDRAGYNWFAQYFASRGYLVIQPQFRGSEGFGAEHLRAGYGEFAKKMQDDLTDSVDHYVKAGLVNPAKVCIFGWSYGGYAALSGGAFTPEKYTCIIAGAGISDLVEMMDDETMAYGEDSSVVYYWKKFMQKGQGDENAYLKQISPVNFAKQFKAPVLLVHGLYDQVVPYKQSLAMESALKKAGKKVTMVKLEDEGHNLNYQKSRLLLLKSIDDFLAENMK